MKTFKLISDQIEWTRINNCVNGNPRYVCHFLHLLKSDSSDSINDKYRQAVNVAKELGGKKYHTKQYGGGIVFSSYNLLDETERILELTGEAIRCNRPPNAYELKMGYGATHYRTFMKSDITNSKGELKKWFKCPNDGLNYSTK
jgi:hypothetical protein